MKVQKFNGQRNRLSPALLGTAFLLFTAVSFTAMISVRPVCAQEVEPLTSLDDAVHVPGGTKPITINAENKGIRELLRQLASQAGFNMVLDDSVNGNITLSLTKVPIDQALRTIADLSSLEIIPQDGHIYLVIAKQTAIDKGLTRQMTKVLRVKYGNANRLAMLLNSSLFAADNATSGASSSSGNTGGFMKARPDYRTNSIIILGTAREIQLAEDALAKLDRPRESKTFHLSHSNALDVATQLSSSVFNDGNNVFQVSSSSGSSSSSAAAAGPNGSTGVQASPVRVQQENIQEGSGINNLVSDSSGGSSGGGSSTSDVFSQNIVLRGTVKSSQVANISPDGPLVVPDTRLNTVTVMGTAEQIAMAEKLIPIWDAQLPQVSIEASLIELTEDGAKQLGTNFGLSQHKFNFGFNNGTFSNTNGVIGLPTLDPSDSNQSAYTGAGYTSSPIAPSRNLFLQLNALVSTKRAKVIANPSIVATHDSEAVISIVDEIVRQVNVQVDGITGTTQISTVLGEAGIILDILPKIGEDGTVNLRIRPSVSTVRDVERDSNNNIITLLSKRDLLAQDVRIKDGQSLVLGGLINQNDSVRQDKIPMLGDLPVVGALMRASQKNSTHNEIMILITPHILNNTKLTPVATSDPFKTPINSPQP